MLFPQKINPKRRTRGAITCWEKYWRVQRISLFSPRFLERRKLIYAAFVLDPGLNIMRPNGGLPNLACLYCDLMETFFSTPTVCRSFPISSLDPLQYCTMNNFLFVIPFFGDKEPQNNSLRKNMMWNPVCGVMILHTTF